MKTTNLDSNNYARLDSIGVRRYATEFFAEGSTEKDIKNVENAGFHYDENLNLFVKEIFSPQGKQYLAYCSFLEDHEDRYSFIDGEGNKLLDGETFSLIRTFNDDNFALIRKTRHRDGKEFLYGVIDLSNLKEILPCKYARIYQDEKNENLLTIQKYNSDPEKFDLSAIKRTAVPTKATAQKKYNSKKSLKPLNKMTQAELIKEHKRINRKIGKYYQIIDLTIAWEPNDFPAISLYAILGLPTALTIGIVGPIVVDNLCGTKLGAGWALVGFALPIATAICYGSYAKIASAYYENKDKKVEKLHKKICGKSIEKFENEQARKFITQLEQ